MRKMDVACCSRVLENVHQCTLLCMVLTLQLHRVSPQVFSHCRGGAHKLWICVSNLLVYNQNVSTFPLLAVCSYQYPLACRSSCPLLGIHFYALGQTWHMVSCFGQSFFWKCSLVEKIAFVGRENVKKTTTSICYCLGGGDLKLRGDISCPKGPEKITGFGQDANV